MKIDLNFPDNIIHSLKFTKSDFKRKALIYILGKLFEEGKISSGIAAEILKCDKWEFYKLISENGFSVFNYSIEDIEEEVRK